MTTRKGKISEVDEDLKKTVKNKVDTVTKAKKRVKELEEEKVTLQNETTSVENETHKVLDLREKLEGLTEELKEIAAYRDEVLKKEIELAKEKLELAKVELEKEKERYEEAKKVYDDTKKDTKADPNTLIAERMELYDINAEIRKAVKQASDLKRDVDIMEGTIPTPAHRTPVAEIDDSFANFLKAKLSNKKKKKTG